MAAAELERLVDQLHESRLRVWSIVITLFGDAIVPRGGVAWLSTLRAITGRLRIESGTLGAALSRLTADGWLIREKRGRRSAYGLNESGQALFTQAAQRIYGPDPAPEPDRWWLLFSADPPPETGWGRLDGRTYLLPRTSDVPPAPLPSGAHPVRACLDPDGLRPLVTSAFELGPVAAAYRSFGARFSALYRAEPEALSPLDAMAARTLMVHEFRRVVLKDPVLPSVVRPHPWAGDQARELAAGLYRALLPASEAWLSAPDRTPGGALPAPDASFYGRFGGLAPKVSSITSQELARDGS